MHQEKYHEYKFQINPAEHYAALKERHDNLSNVNFRSLINFSECVCIELDAAMKFQQNKSDSKLKDYYTKFCPDMKNDAYHVSYDLIDQSPQNTNAPHPLECITTHNCQILLDHPVVRLLLRKKWKIALVFYILFVLYFAVYTILLTVYINGVTDFVDGNQSFIQICQNQTSIQKCQRQLSAQICEEGTPAYIFELCIIIIVVAVIGIGMEIFQICCSKSYCTAGNITHNV